MASRQVPTLPSLDEALVWAEARWANQRAAPIRLHAARTTDGELGGPMFSAAFITALDGSDNATQTLNQSTACAHPSVTARDRDEGRLCPMCSIYDEAGQPIVESNVYQRSVDRFRYPMTRALARLSNGLRPRHEVMPHPYRTVLVLASHGWDARATARILELGWDAAEAHFLRSLRQLHRWYEEAPTPNPSYVDKSESQRNAETWTAA